MTKYKNAYFRIRKNGTYELRLRQNNTNISFYGKTQKETKEKYDIWLKENKTKETKEKSITLNEWYNKWIELYKIHKIKPKSLKALKNAVENHFISKLGNKDIKKISLEELQVILNDMSEMGNTKNKVYFYIKEIFKKAKINNIIKNDISINLEITKAKSAESKIYTSEEQKILLNQKRTTEFIFICFMLFTGTRPNEAKKFKLSDININNNTIHIRGTKTDDSNRYIPYFDSVKNLIKDIKQNEVFKGMKVDTAYRELKKIFPHHNLRELRTTFTTNCHTASVSPKIVQKWLGHTTVEMTMNTYTKISNELEIDNINRINNFYPKTYPNK